MFSKPRDFVATPPLGESPLRTLLLAGEWENRA